MALEQDLVGNEEETKQTQINRSGGYANRTNTGSTNCDDITVLNRAENEFHLLSRRVDDATEIELKKIVSAHQNNLANSRDGSKNSVYSAST